MFSIKTPVLHQAKIKFACKTFAVSIKPTLGWLYFKKKYLVGILKNQIIKKKNFKMEKTKSGIFLQQLNQHVLRLIPDQDNSRRTTESPNIIRFNRRSTLLRNVGFFYSWSPSFCLWHVIQFHHKSTCLQYLPFFC